MTHEEMVQAVVDTSGPSSGEEPDDVCVEPVRAPLEPDAMYRAEADGSSLSFHDTSEEGEKVSGDGFSAPQHAARAARSEQSFAVRVRSKHTALEADESKISIIDPKTKRVTLMQG